VKKLIGIFDCEIERDGKLTIPEWVFGFLAVLSPFVGIALTGLIGGR